MFMRYFACAGFVNCYADLARPARLGRTQLGSLCSDPPTTTTGFCGVAVATVAHFAFNATTSGIFRFSAAASDFEAVIGLVYGGSCQDIGCNAPKQDLEIFQSYMSEISAFLSEGSSVIVTIAPFNGSCINRAVALDISAETPYGLRLFVDPFAGSDSWPYITSYNSTSNVSLDAVGAPVRRYASIDAALAYAEQRILSDAPGEAVEVRMNALIGVRA
eukprot:tig00000025_g7948.t1